MGGFPHSLDGFFRGHSSSHSLHLSQRMGIPCLPIAAMSPVMEELVSSLKSSRLESVSWFSTFSPQKDWYCKLVAGREVNVFGRLSSFHGWFFSGSFQFSFPTSLAANGYSLPAYRSDESSHGGVGFLVEVLSPGVGFLVFNM